MGMAERVGFEPTVPLQGLLLSRQPSSTARAPLRPGGGCRIRTHGPEAGTTAFKAAAFVRSANPPYTHNAIKYGNCQVSAVIDDRFVFWSALLEERSGISGLQPGNEWPCTEWCISNGYTAEAV